LGQHAAGKLDAASRFSALVCIRCCGSLRPPMPGLWLHIFQIVNVPTLSGTEIHETRNFNASAGGVPARRRRRRRRHGGRTNGIQPFSRGSATESPFGINTAFHPGAPYLEARLQAMQAAGIKCVRDPITTAQEAEEAPERAQSQHGQGFDAHFRFWCGTHYNSNCPCHL
jgi:hypothetical protein